LIEPAQSDGELLADVARNCGRDDESFRVWWLGQSGFLVQYRGAHLLFDPYLSESLTRKYATTDKPHVRMTRRAVDPTSLTFVDAVTSTHNHTDHLDAETLNPILVAGHAKLVVAAANATFAAERLKRDSGEFLVLDVGERGTIGPFEIEPVPAAHEDLDRDDAGRHLYVGFVVRFGPHVVYHAGDTVRYPGMAERLRPFGIELAFLPINGRGPERRVSGNLWGREAAALAKDAGIGRAIPCHYEMFEFNTASPAEFVAECERLGQECTVLRCGERYDSSVLREEEP
jgi:L-ascorbate metabolism protein UlaG (beta-lactamase superfamily)